MADKIIDIVRKAIAARNERQDVTFGYGLERHSYKTMGMNRFGDEDKYHRYWITSFPTDPKHMFNGDDIILYRNAPITRIEEWPNSTLYEPANPLFEIVKERCHAHPEYRWLPYNQLYRIN